MPWKTVKGHGCTGSMPWAVIRSDTGKKVSCHASQADAEKHMAALYANENSADPGGDERAQLAAKSINNLPDSAFAYIEPGGKKDATGKTIPRSLRHFPIHDAAHVRNALARAPQSPFGKKAMPKIRAAAKKFGVHMSENSRPDLGLCLRAFDFEVRSSGGDGRTLEGHAAVFNTPARIRDLHGDFDEIIMPGAFTRSLASRTPVMQFEHGRDPRVGAVPIAAIEDIREDDTGLYVRARLYDNPVIEPVRQAIVGKSINGMSFRFSVPDGGDKWSTRSGDVELREIYDTDTAEIGPVVFPAYDATSVSVRSLLAQLDPGEHRALIRELAAELRLAADLEDLTVAGARSAETEEPGTQPGNGERPPVSIRSRVDHDALRLRGVIP
jgi:HK97 family phage prohead protease